MFYCHNILNYYPDKTQFFLAFKVTDAIISCESDIWTYIFKEYGYFTTNTCKWTTQDWTATNACLKILKGKASVGMSKGYCCIALKILRTTKKVSESKSKHQTWSLKETRPGTMNQPWTRLYQVHCTLSLFLHPFQELQPKSLRSWNFLSALILCNFDT